MTRYFGSRKSWQWKNAKRRFDYSIIFTQILNKTYMTSIFYTSNMIKNIFLILFDFWALKIWIWHPESVNKLIVWNYWTRICVLDDILKERIRTILIKFDKWIVEIKSDNCIVNAKLQNLTKIPFYRYLTAENCQCSLEIERKALS